MSKLIYVCARQQAVAGSFVEAITSICGRLAPDNISPRAPKVVQHAGIAYGIMNPCESVLTTDSGVVMGLRFEKDSTPWSTPLQAYPDGSYAIFRADPRHVELLTDAVGSRSIWYYKDDEIFVASTSQRAIVMFLRSFVFDERVIPWVLSTGTLGPVFGWDKRILRVPPDTSLVLDREAWSLSQTSGSVEFDPQEMSDQEHEARIRTALVETFEAIPTDKGHWIIPLSGGYDSRSILCFLQHASGGRQPMETITWGLTTHRSMEHTDAWVAERVATACGASNEYYPTDDFSESVEQMLTKFLLAGEGRTDAINAYTDGFKLWKVLFDKGVTGIFRGDECFGWRAISSELTVRLRGTIALCSDFANLQDYRNYGFAEQQLPEDLLRREGESLSTWRDRLIQQRGMAVHWGAMADLKLGYVEQVCPLMSRRILEEVRRLPDRLRTEKVLFKKIVASAGPRVEFSRERSTGRLENILAREDMVEFISEKLSTNHAKSVLPEEFLASLVRGLRVTPVDGAGRSGNLKARVKTKVPWFVKNILYDRVGTQRVDENVLAFRGHMVCEMVRILNADARA